MEKPIFNLVDLVLNVSFAVEKLCNLGVCDLDTTVSFEVDETTGEINSMEIDVGGRHE